MESFYNSWFTNIGRKYISHQDLDNSISHYNIVVLVWLWNLVVLPLFWGKYVSFDSHIWKLVIKTYGFLWRISEKIYITCLTAKCSINGNCHWSEMILLIFLKVTTMPCTHQYLAYTTNIFLLFLWFFWVVIFWILTECRMLGDSFNGWEKSGMFSYYLIYSCSSQVWRYKVVSKLLSLTCILGDVNQSHLKGVGIHIFEISTEKSWGPMTSFEAWLDRRIVNFS